MKATYLLGIGIPANKIKVCHWCPESYRDAQTLLEHQRKCHGYVGPTSPRVARGALRSVLRREAAAGVEE